MVSMGEENLYLNVKNRICDFIFQGAYEEGGRIPAERQLAEQLDVSRVTVRRALELLEQDRLVVREVGSGTRVCLHNYGNMSSMDMIVLVAPAKNPFFAEFIAQFQEYAQKENSLLLYVEKPGKESLENCLYRLYGRGLHDVVIWLEDLAVDLEKLKRLRALGMNMVFFDTDRGFPYADCVTLDNEGAIRALYESLRDKGCTEIAYAGWDRKDIYSIARREKAYASVSGQREVFLHLPWGERQKSHDIVLARLSSGPEGLPDAIICGDRECGKAVSGALGKLKLKQVRAAAVDGFPEARRRHVTVCAQNLERTVGEIYDCLRRQSREGEKWKARVYMIEGILHLH